MLKKFTQVLTTLGVNSIPAVGWFAGGWSAGTTLGLYWAENLVATLLIAARIIAQSRMNPRCGHIDYRPRQRAVKEANGGSYLSAFLPTALAFSLAHGVFLGLLFFVLTKNGHASEVAFSGPAFAKGATGMAGFLLANFLVDLPGLAARPFHYVENLGQRLLSRVVLVHLTLILGMAAVAFTGATRTFFAVFVGLKTLSDLTSLLPAWNPPRMPGWLGLVRIRDGKSSQGETIDEFWQAFRAGEARRLEENEKPIRR